MFNKLKERYQHAFETELLSEIDRVGIYQKFNAETSIIDIGDTVGYMPLLLSGSLKVMREDTDESELLLYYLEVGDTCALTLSCWVQKTKSKIKAITESDSELILIPIDRMEDWVLQYESWRNFLFESFCVRLDEMLESIDNLAFHNMKERIYRYLVDKAIVSKNVSVTVTHSQIASELNTSRAVVSRLLKKLTAEGKVRLYRSRIEVQNNYIK